MTGFIATEPDLDYDRLPMFLIDCRTRKGNSGSPVIAHRDPGPHLMDDGTMTIWGTPVHRMMGIYSGRMNEESDIGMVWKASALQELIESIK